MRLSLAQENTKSAKEETQKAQRNIIDRFAHFVSLAMRILCSTVSPSCKLNFIGLEAELQTSFFGEWIFNKMSLQASADGEPVGEAGNDHGQFGGFDRFGDVHSKTRGQGFQAVFGPPERGQGDGGN